MEKKYRSGHIFDYKMFTTWTQNMDTLHVGYGHILDANPLKALFYKGFRKLASPRGFEPLLPG